MYENNNSMTYYTILSIFADSCTIFWLYSIIFHSPLEMQQYKYALIRLAACDLAFNLELCIVFLPDILAPVPGAAVLGISRHFGEFGVNAAFFAAFVFGFSAYCAINDCCVTRWCIVFDKKDFIEFMYSTKGAVIIVLLQCLVMFGFLFPSFVFAHDTQEHIISYAISHNTSFALEYYREQGALFVALDLEGAAYIWFLGMTCTGIVALHTMNFIFTFGILIHIKKNILIMSARTYEAQKQLTIMLLMQNLYPLVAITGPITMSLYVVYMKMPESFTNSDVFKHYCVTAMLFYPVASAFFGFYFVRPHRVFVVSIIHKVLSAIPCVPASFTAKAIVEPENTYDSSKI